MKGLFIPKITAEMFRNGCLESIEQLMAEGEIYDIEYPLEQEQNTDTWSIDEVADALVRHGILKRVPIQEPCEDCISREQTKAEIRKAFPQLKDRVEINSILNGLPSVKQEPKTDYKVFAEWVASEIFSEDWEYNKDSFQEIACRKLAKLGLVEVEGYNWVLKESEVEND